ncbi:MAG: transporter substrate-binding domain-containing protein [Gammaproteobacteria bacterium]|nr:transporter substrate-binding domain-containing protein [Gammaproteobacteria bacterium]
MNKKNLFLHAFSAILIMASVISTAETETIKFAFEIYPPFAMLNARHELQGFDIDIAKALCEKIGVKHTFSDDSLKNMGPSLKSGQYDAWISSITIDSKRLKDVTFTGPYFSSTARLIATKNTVFNGAPIEIKGKTLGVKEHTCYIEYLQKTYGDRVIIKSFATKNDAYIALENGLVDAVIDDVMALKHWRFLQKDPKEYRLISLPAKYSNLVWHKYGIAVAKDNLELAKTLDNALAQIKADGTYDKIVEKYFAN